MTKNSKNESLTIDLLQPQSDILQGIADEHGLTTADTLHKAVAMFAAAHQATINDDEIAIVDASGRIKKKLMFPG
jgi:hypothetical protein